MRLSKKECALLQRTLHTWQQEGLLTPEETEKLTSTLQPQDFDWQRLARYAFLTSLATFAISFITLFGDYDIWMRLTAWFGHYPQVNMLVAAVLAQGCFWQGSAPLRTPMLQRSYRYEALLFLGVIFVALALWQWAEWYDRASVWQSTLFLLATLIYGLCGWLTRSSLVWFAALIALNGSFLCIIIDYSRFYANLAVGYALPFTLCNLMMLFILFTVRSLLHARGLYRISLSITLFFLLCGFWLLSLIGNNEQTSWSLTSPLTFWYWAVLAVIATLAVTLWGIKQEDSVIRTLGLTFLTLNLLTRYVEYCWNVLPASLFFAIAGVLLWLGGRYAERLWRRTSN